MTKMAAPYTGATVEVAPSRVAARLAEGYRLLEGWEPEPEPVEPEEEPELPEPPDMGSTIPEIRAYARAVGARLPSKGTKTDLLSALGLGE